MENDALKSAWQGMDTPQKSNTELKSIMQESAHPVLKGIRMQLMIEIVGFTVFLLVYYDFFDGDRKPFYANVLLVSAMLFVIVHNIIGYVLTKRGVKGNNIKQSLEDRFSKMKTYAMVSIATRMLAAVCLWFFFLSVIKFNADRYWMLAVVVLVVVVQITVLSKIWVRRIKRMKEAIGSFGL
ncbi:hypothetical protein [Parapedobacter tibetensis]|uniref:hypothetical protein n=1 Tax=Parapedobacter tibetensis TaxID=2972951 RepID=UPI00214D32A4|nr:hypothetical protein [Parapedobacter tibetensis]